MSDLPRLLLALADDPADDTGWLALADCLEEAGDSPRAELVRLQLSLRRRPDDPEAVGCETRLRQLWSAGVEACQPTLDGPAGLVFVLVPPGAFLMGARDGETWAGGDERPRHLAAVPDGFWLARTPVTSRQYHLLMGLPPPGDDAPLAETRHDDALGFCARLAERTGRRCRLPTEAEWEYACRAGTVTSFCSGEGVEALELVGWCSYDGTWDGSGGVRPVAQGRANSWGLFDMHGNVWEWCADGWDGYPRGRTAEPHPEGQGRVVRGGSWRGGPWFCRSASRWSLPTDARGINIGFRPVMELS